MDILALITFVLLIVSSVCFAYACYLLNRVQNHIREAVKICENAAKSLRSGGV